MRLVLASLLIASTAAALPPPRDVHGEIVALEQRYLDGLFAAKPHLASFMGDHRFDDRIVDLSEAALKKRHDELTKTLAKIAALRPTATDDKVDLEIMRDGARLELLYLDEIRDWAWDPRLYDSFPSYDPREVVAGRLADIMHGDFAPEAARKKSMVAELLGLPAYLTQSEGWLGKPYRGQKVPTGWRNPPKVYVEQAIKDNRGRIDFIGGEVGAFLGADGKTAVNKALLALDHYQSFLEKELLPKADGEWKLGRAVYDKKFPLALQTKRSPDEVVARAHAEFDRSRKELIELSKKLHLELWPAEGMPTGAALVNKVKDELSKAHAKPGELVAAHARRLDALRTFLEKNHMVDLPGRETLSVEPMPAYKRGSSAAEYLAPGLLDKRPGFHATYYVDPIDPTWPKERVESYLRGQNDYEVELVAAHEAYPGHHTQTFQAKKSLNALRATLWNGPMVEGWAVYGEGQVVKRGWGGLRNDRYRFFDLRGRMISASNLILDVGLQRGTMTDAEAVRMMVEDGFQEPAMAEKKLLRAKLDSTQLAQYFLGLDEIESLEGEVLKAQGRKPDAAFHYDYNMGLISHGSIAVRFLRDYLLAPAK
ncbi:MAG: DUF885 domain-containing protein [Polyangia bacterium]